MATRPHKRAKKPALKRKRRVKAAPLTKYRVTGFCDLIDKPRGAESITHFRAEHQIACDVLPVPDWLMAYAKKHGYYPSGKIGAVKGHCDPVYRYEATR